MPTSVKQAVKHFNAEALYRDLLEQVRAGLFDVTHSIDMADVAIVGIHSGGAWLAERLAADLGAELGPELKGRLGFIDVSFYRDDYAKKGLHPDVKPTQIGFNVDRATILLVDDVLYTGRTTRAAINVLFDYGRPSRIMLAALADRGGRELPVAADFVAVQVPLEPTQALVLARGADGTLSLTIEEDHA